jgi:16S rRNA (cytosine1402-N4)-methyltransferase
MAYHIPVLAKETIDGLNVRLNGMYVDATYGGGGHSRLILEKLQSGKLLAFDQDNDARNNVQNDNRLIFVNENFRYLKNFTKLYGFLPVDGILADLGISSWQIDTAVRGFSTRFEGPLDMRMNKNGERTAAWVVNNYESAELTDVFKFYGELRNARRIAEEIVFHRKNQVFETTEGFKAVLLKLAPRGKENKFFAQIFQALRIEVNNELDVLKEFLLQSTDVLKTGGRLVVISYHSLEDRLVKNFMRSGNFKGEAEKDFFGNVLSPLKPVGKLIIPTQEEQAENPRSRSAKLRIAEKIA